MEIWHRVAFNSTVKPDFLIAIDKVRIQYKASRIPAIGPGSKESQLVYFDIAESNPSWPEVSNLIETYGASNMAETFFSEEEILNAEWLRLIPVYERGYPQPENDYWYKNPSNDFSCSKCGIYKQIKPYRIKSNISIKDNEFISLYWTYALFCNLKLIEEFKTHSISGFEDWNTIIHKTNQPSESIHQIYIPNIAKPGLVEDELKKVTCSKCGTVKYYPHVRGIMHFKKSSLLEGLDFQLSREWFGSGGSAYREIIISNRLAKLILEKGWKGVRFKIIDLV